MKHYHINPQRTKPRTAAERRHRRLLAANIIQLRREIRAERKAKRLANAR